MSRKRGLLGASVFFLWMAAAGCQSELEDGYKPRALNASPAQRRAYYASPFTPEAAAAEQEGQGSAKSHQAGTR